MKTNVNNLKYRTYLLRKRLSMFLLCLIAGTLFSAFAFSMLQVESKNTNAYIPKASTAHSPISIDGNAALDAFCAGKGTDGLSWDTAHVIEDLEIDAEGVGSGIDIRNTDRFLIIRRCTITNSGDVTPTATSFYADCGFWLEYINNLKITECDVNNNQVGIYLAFSYYNIISDNVLSNNRLNGISSFNSDHNMFSDNEITYNYLGLKLKSDSNYNTVSGNNVSYNELYGIKLESLFGYGSENNTISGNTASYNGQYGIYLGGDCNNNEVYQNIVCHNELGNINDLGENNDIHDNEDCSQPEGIPSYPIAWISAITLYGVAISIYIVQKRRKK
jgi:parallel beta-helix repeat protein